MRPVIVVLLLALALLLVPTANAEQVQSDELQPGTTFDHTFDSPANYTYHDHKNPSAEGSIMVMADSDGSTDQVDIQIRDDGGDVRFEPADITIEVGDTVRWTNSGSQVHQVMAWTEGDQMDMNDMDHGGHDGHDDGHGHSHGTESAESPAPPVLLTLVGLAGLATLRRK